MSKSPQRHGLRTVLLTTAGVAGHRQSDRVLAGSTVQYLRALAPPETGPASPLEAVGERVLLIDAAGHSVAVLQVDAVHLTHLGALGADGGPAGPWAGPPATRSNDRTGVVTFHVVGLETS